MDCFSCSGERAAVVRCRWCHPGKLRIYCADCDSKVHRGVWKPHDREKVIPCDICTETFAKVLCRTCTRDVSGATGVHLCDPCLDLVHGVSPSGALADDDCGVHQIDTNVKQGDLKWYLSGRRKDDERSATKRKPDDDDDVVEAAKRLKELHDAGDDTITKKVSSPSPPVIVLESDDEEEKRSEYAELRVLEPLVHSQATFFGRMEDTVVFQSRRTAPLSVDPIRLAQIRKESYLALQRATTGTQVAGALRNVHYLVAALCSESPSSHAVDINIIGGRARAIGFFRNEPDKSPVKQFPPGTWLNDLARFVAHTFQVRHFYIRHTLRLVFYGVPELVDIAAYVFETALNKLVVITRNTLHRHDLQFLLGMVQEMVVVSTTAETDIRRREKPDMYENRSAWNTAAMNLAATTLKMLEKTNPKPKHSSPSPNATTSVPNQSPQ